MAQEKAKAKKIRRSNGSGSFRKRADGTIEYRASYGYDTAGQLIRKSFYGKTQAECRQKKTEYDKNHTIPLEQVCLVSEWARRWLELYKKDKCSLNMYDQYKMIVDNYINPNIGQLELSAVKPAHIVEMMNKYKGKSDSQVKKVMISLRGIFETAVDNELCNRNPAKNVKAEGVKPKEKGIFSEKEIDIIEKFCFAERSNISDSLVLLLYSGLRREELLGLKWEDIDFENETISVVRSVIMELNTKVLKSSLKSEDSLRVIPLLPKARMILESKAQSSEFVFPNMSGDYQNPETFSKMYKRLISRINRNNDKDNQIRDLSAHCCRHTFATYLSARGIDIKIIQSVLGHADISMTSRYTHDSLEGMKKALTGFKY